MPQDHYSILRRSIKITEFVLLMLFTNHIWTPNHLQAYPLSCRALALFECIRMALTFAKSFENYKRMRKLRKLHVDERANWLLFNVQSVDNWYFERTQSFVSSFLYFIIFKVRYYRVNFGALARVGGNKRIRTWDILNANRPTKRIIFKFKSVVRIDEKKVCKIN